LVFAGVLNLMKTENAKNNKNEYEQLIELLLKKYGGDNKAASLTEICDENKKYAAKIKAMGRKSRDLFGTTLAQYLKQIGVIGKKKKSAKVEEDFGEEADIADEPAADEDLKVAQELEADIQPAYGAADGYEIPGGYGAADYGTVGNAETNYDASAGYGAADYGTVGNAETNYDASAGYGVADYVTPENVAAEFETLGEYDAVGEYTVADEHVLEEDLKVAQELEAEAAAGVAFEEHIIKETERRISQEYEPEAHSTTVDAYAREQYATAEEYRNMPYSTMVENTRAQDSLIVAGDYKPAEYSAASDMRRVEDIVAEELRAEEEFRRREEERRAEKERRAEEEYKLKLEEERRAEEERIAAEERKAEAARRIEEERKAEAERKAGEIRRLRELALKRYEEEYTAWILRCNKRIAEREEEFKRRLRDKQFELESAAEFKRSEAIEAALQSMIEHQKKLVEAQKILNSLWFFRFIAKRKQKARILKAEAGIAEAKENIMRAKDIYQNEIMEIDSKVKEAEGEIRLSVERDYPMPVEPVLTGY